MAVPIWRQRVNRMQCLSSFPRFVVSSPGFRSLSTEGITEQVDLAGCLLCATARAGASDEPRSMIRQTTSGD